MKKTSRVGSSFVLKENLLYSGRWADMIEFSYKDEEKKLRKWEGLHRKKQTTAVIIVAQLKPSGRYIIIKQFRPPTDSYILEFPAGLVDPGESIGNAAKRELLEETGFSGKVEIKSPNLFSSPGILSETVTFVNISVDENIPENKQPIPKNEPGEFITVFLKFPNEISEFFDEELKKGVLFDAKLYSYFMGQGVL